MELLFMFVSGLIVGLLFACASLQTGRLREADKWAAAADSESVEHRGRTYCVFETQADPAPVEDESWMNLAGE